MIKLNNHSSKRNETILEVVIFVDVVWVITERKARLVGFGCSFDETPRCIVDSDVVRFCSSLFYADAPQTAVPDVGIQTDVCPWLVA